ncbi:hypothetical protein ABPG72_019962 [Tetrahymena utriculariae]
MEMQDQLINLKKLNQEDKLKLLHQLKDELENEKAIQIKPTFTIDQKIQHSIQALQSNNISDYGRKNNIPESTLRFWIKEHLNPEEIKSLKPLKRKRSIKYLLMEIKVIIEVISKRTQKICVSQSTIKKIAKDIFQELQKEGKPQYVNQSFQASNGWFYRFQQRWFLSYRVSTHAAQSLSDSIFDKICINMKQFAEYRFKQIQDNNSVALINIDEVPLNFDITSEKTYDFQGLKNIETLKSLGQKLRMTVVLSIMVEGSKEKEIGLFLPPLFIFKSTQKKQIQHSFGNECIVTHNKKGWNTSELYVSYLEAIITNQKLAENQKIALIQDQFSGHQSEIVKEWSLQNKVNLHNLVAGSTFLTQPIDTHIGKSFKNKVRLLQAEWLEEQIKLNNTNQSGQIKAPKFQQMIEWSLQSLKQFEEGYICDSFKYCGYSSSLDYNYKDHLNKRLLERKEIQQEIERILSSNDLYDEKKNILEELEKQNSTQNTYQPSDSVIQIFQNQIINKKIQVTNYLGKQIQEQVESEGTKHSKQTNEENYDHENESESDGEDEREELEENFKQHEIIYSSNNNNNEKLRIVKENTQEEIVEKKDILLQSSKFKKNIEQVFFDTYNNLIREKYSRKYKPKPKQQQKSISKQQNTITNYFV